MNNKGRFVKGKHNSKKTEFKKGQPKSKKWYASMKKRVPWNKGNSGYKTKPASEERKLKISLAQKGKPKWTEDEKNKYFRGKNASNWQGGKTLESKRIRNSIQFRLWRESVFARDNWTCQGCKKRGCELHPHHIKSFAKFPELRFAIDNGVTLCKECHKLTDNYGSKERRKNG